jgi:hypothetical protein
VVKLGEPAFDLCLQDVSTNNILRLNSATGDYQFVRCSDGLTLAGKAAILFNNACYLEVRDQQLTCYLSARVYKCGNYAQAQVSALPLGFTQYLMDNNLLNSTCACP